MQVGRSFVLALALLVATPAAGSSLNPLGKAISLMQDLKAKITKDGEVEAKAYAEYVQWCDDVSRNTKFEIETASAKKEKLGAKIGKLSADIESSGAKVEDLAGSVAKGTGELKDATLIREKDAATFAASEKELMEVVDTLGRAIGILGKEMEKNPALLTQTGTASTASLLQSLGAIVDAAGFSNTDRKRLMALVQSRQGEDEDAGEMGPPAAAVYASQSGGILDTLEDLKEKAEEQLSTLRKEEVNSKHNYEMLKQSLEDQAAADDKDKAEQASIKAASAEAKAGAEDELARTTADLTNAESELEAAQAGCMTTAADHGATVKAREEELKVIAEAIKVLTDTSSGAVGRTYSFLQVKAARSSAKLQTHADLARLEVLTLVKQLAKKHHSAALAQLASRIDAVVHFGNMGRDGPFTKVKGLIQDLIMRLEAEASAEADEKAYCDEETAKTEMKKSELSDVIAKLTAKIDQAAAKSGSLKEEVKELQEELAALATEQSDMDKIRQESNADYIATKADLELGLSGLRKALNLLRSYYSGADSGDDMSALMQGPVIPEKHSKAAGAGSKIVGILEVVESDFATNLAKEETQESDAAAEYEKITDENKITKTLKDQDVKYKTQEFKSLEKTISELASDRESTDSQLAAVLEYYGKIKERCIAKPETYEERKKRREAEIQGLKEALEILKSETAAFLQKSGRKSRHMTRSATGAALLAR